MPVPWLWHEQVAWGANLLLAIAGIGGICVAVKTLGSIKKQVIHMGEQTKVLEASVDAAEKSAAAAHLNALALLNSERAWLLVSDVKLMPDNPFGTSTQFSYRIRNYGRTPGQLLAVKAELQVGRETFAPPDEKVFELTGSSAVAGMPIPPGRSLKRESAAYRFTPEQRQKVFDEYADELFLWACGYLKYEDAFGQSRETRFCYRLILLDRNFYLDGIPGVHNKAT